jgi:hypothetical protein
LCDSSWNTHPNTSLLQIHCTNKLFSCEYTHIFLGATIFSRNWYSAGQRSQYSDWLLAGRSRGQNSCPGEVEIFHFSMSSGPALGCTQPPIQWVSEALSPGVKRPGREADHSPPTSAEVKKMWIYTSTPSYAFMV